MRISDWSSDVCSSDLAFGICAPRLNSLQPYYRRGQGADGTLRREQMTPMPPARLALAIQASLLLSFAGIASAQDAAPAEPTDQAQTLDTVTVTGTRIKKAELESQVPVQVLTREDIDRSGLTSVAHTVPNTPPRAPPPGWPWPSRPRCCCRLQASRPPRTPHPPSPPTRRRPSTRSP